MALVLSIFSAVFDDDRLHGVLILRYVCLIGIFRTDFALKYAKLATALVSRVPCHAHRVYMCNFMLLYVRFD